MEPPEPGEAIALGLSGDQLIFPDGRPFCLVCGRRPLGTRVVRFRDPDFADRETRPLNTLLQFVHPLLGQLNTARLVSFEFGAPLCWRHLGRGLAPDIAALAAFVLVVAGLVLLALKGADRGYLKLGLVAAVILAGFFFVRRGRRRPKLPCVALRETRERVILVYAGGAPRPR